MAKAGRPCANDLFGGLANRGGILSRRANHAELLPQGPVPGIARLPVGSLPPRVAQGNFVGKRLVQFVLLLRAYRTQPKVHWHRFSIKRKPPVKNLHTGGWFEKRLVNNLNGKSLPFLHQLFQAGLGLGHLPTQFLDPFEVTAAGFLQFGG